MWPIQWLITSCRPLNHEKILTRTLFFRLRGLRTSGCQILENRVTCVSDSGMCWRWKNVWKKISDWIPRCKLFPIKPFGKPTKKLHWEQMQQTTCVFTQDTVQPGDFVESFWEREWNIWWLLEMSKGFKACGYFESFFLSASDGAVSSCFETNFTVFIFEILKNPVVCA